MYEMLVGIPPFYDNDRNILFKNIGSKKLDLPKYISLEAKDLIVKLLEKNPEKRLGTHGGADEIKAH